MLAEHFEHVVDTIVKDQWYASEQYLWDMEPELIINTLLTTTHDVEVAERMLGDSHVQKTPEGLMDRIGVVVHIVRFVQIFRSNHERMREVENQMEQEHLKQQIAELSMQLSAQQKQG